MEGFITIVITEYPDYRAGDYMSNNGKCNFSIKNIIKKVLFVDLIQGLVVTFGYTFTKTITMRYPDEETWIPYQLPDDMDVCIRIYSVSGQLIKKLELGHKTAGSYTSKDKAAYWDGKNEAGEKVSSGVYFYTIQAGDFTATRKMVVAK